MALISEEFRVSYELLYGVCKVVPSGTFNNNPYPASVKVTSRIVEEGAIDPKTGFPRMYEHQLIFKFLCPDDMSAGKFAYFLQKSFATKKPVYFKGSNPKYNADSKQMEVTINELPAFEEVKSTSK